jgi:hypothetical protein
MNLSDIDDKFIQRFTSLKNLNFHIGIFVTNIGVKALKNLTSLELSGYTHLQESNY